MRDVGKIRLYHEASFPIIGNDKKMRKRIAAYIDSIGFSNVLPCGRYSCEANILIQHQLHISCKLSFLNIRLDTNSNISTLHGVPLEERSNKGKRCYRSEGVSCGDEPTSNPDQRGLVGLLVIGSGVALLRFSPELLYKTNETSRLFPVAMICLFMAIGLIVHGDFYAFLGQWCITSP